MTSTDPIAGSLKHLPNTAPSRGFSPVRSPLSSSSPTTHKMPSPRPSPAIRPQSPLSPRFESSNPFGPLRPPSPRSMPQRPGNSQRRANTSSLKLPTLPRFHPANFASTHSSAQTTPDSGQCSPQAPASPRMHQRVISDAQKHLLAYQRDMISAAARASTPPQLINPESPRLVPLGSPGPVTPLELEGEAGDYLITGARTNDKRGALSPDELIEQLLEEENSRQWRGQSRPTR